MTGEPKKIWLQIAEHDDEDWKNWKDIPQDVEITWCQDNINPSDLEYVCSKPITDEQLAFIDAEIMIENPKILKHDYWEAFARKLRK